MEEDGCCTAFAVGCASATLGGKVEIFASADDVRLSAGAAIHRGRDGGGSSIIVGHHDRERK